MANPAARKCLDDGYQLEPVRAADGLPIAHDCVDQRSGKRCDAWDYFRGDCRLDPGPSPSAPRAG
jgi:putative hemolysin